VQKIAVEIGWENNKQVLAVKINDPDTNLADLLDAWQPFCDNKTINKLYAAERHKECRGCEINCCNTAYLIPDIIAFKKICQNFDLDYHEGTRRFFAEDKIDLGVMRLKGNPCCFLKDGLCQIYTNRSLLCRFYLCTDIAADTEQLLYSLAWTGSAATQIFASEQKLLPGEPRKGSGSFDRLFLDLQQQYQRDTRVQLFMEARDYNEIPLKPFLGDQIIAHSVM